MTDQLDWGLNFNHILLRSWLRHCATSRKVAGSILHGVNGIFYGHNPSDRSSEYRDKGGRRVGLTTSAHSCADCLKIWKSEHPGTLWSRPDLHSGYITFMTHGGQTVSERLANIYGETNNIGKTEFHTQTNALLYRVIHKSLRNFRTRLRNNQERQGRKEHVNR